MRRGMSVNGSFYPARTVELERYFEHFSKLYDESFKLPTVKSKVVIVPHAGYVYSGYTANIAYRILKQSAVKKFVVIGPSHRVAFEGISLCNFDSYETPSSYIENADDIFQKLKNKFDLKCLGDAHAEHSTEVQFPFIKYYMPDAKIVELVYSHADAEYLSEIIEFILEDESCGVIISTDLSHFYEETEAKKLDKVCLESIEKLDLELLRKGCEACGIVGVRAMLLCAKRVSLSSMLLDYRTSAELSKETSSVVGYVSVCFI